MFGKLFGRGKTKPDALGFETSSTVLSAPGSETTMTTSSGTIPAAGFDLGAILATVKAAQEQTGGDREALAEMLRKQFAGEAVVGEESTAGWSMTGQQDPIALLATLTELHEKGVVSDEQFEAQKRRILGE